VKVRGMDSEANKENDVIHTVVMLRHGESAWNSDNRFCGWVDVGLSSLGEKEALSAAKAIQNAGLKFDVAFTSYLKRASLTLDTILNETGLEDVEVIKSCNLNERHYGGLTGLNKADCVEKYGEKQVQIWRRSYDIRPPPMEDDHPFLESISSYMTTVCDMKREDIPAAESLKDLITRTIPYFTDVIGPQIKAGRNVIIAAHGTSLRGIVKYIEDISDEDIAKVNLPTAIPFVYKLDKDLKPVGPKEFLADDETLKKAVEKVANVQKVVKK